MIPLVDVSHMKAIGGNGGLEWLPGVASRLASHEVLPCHARLTWQVIASAGPGGHSLKWLCRLYGNRAPVVYFGPLSCDPADVHHHKRGDWAPTLVASILSRNFILKQWCYVIQISISLSLSLWSSLPVPVSLDLSFIDLMYSHDVFWHFRILIIDSLSNGSQSVLNNAYRTALNMASWAGYEKWPCGHAALTPHGPAIGHRALSL